MKYKELYTKEKQRTKVYFQMTIYAFLLLGIVILGVSLYFAANEPLITPIPEREVIKNGFNQIMQKVEYQVKAYEVEVPIGEDVDVWVGKYVDKYFEGYKRSEMRMIMHCLLHRESGHQAHDATGPHGDGGRAGGSLQYHQPTWERMRKQMIKEGLAEEIGSRYDMEAAIETTVWAIKAGRAKEWGPILRDSKGSTFASCQTPSWYK